jgi:hypothetical protein
MAPFVLGRAPSPTAPKSSRGPNVRLAQVAYLTPCAQVTPATLRMLAVCDVTAVSSRIECLPALACGPRCGADPHLSSASALAVAGPCPHRARPRGKSTSACEPRDPSALARLGLLRRPMRQGVRLVVACRRPRTDGNERGARARHQTRARQRPQQGRSLSLASCRGAAASPTAHTADARRLDAGRCTCARLESRPNTRRLRASDTGRAGRCTAPQRCASVPPCEPVVDAVTRGAWSIAPIAFAPVYRPVGPAIGLVAQVEAFGRRWRRPRRTSASGVHPPLAPPLEVARSAIRVLACVQRATSAALAYGGLAAHGCPPKLISTRTP